MSSDVVSLDQQRRKRALADSKHPALRYVVGNVFYIAHRKDGDRTMCGVTGDLMLAPPGVPLCVECYPLAERA